jgi:Ca2+-transporting ATPase
MQAAVLCNDADLRCEDSNCSIIGDPTEGALVVAGAKAGFKKSEEAERMPRIDEVPFDSEKAYMATLNDAPNQRIIFVKGAPEKVAAMCSSILCEGEAVDLTTERMDKIRQTNQYFASQALRVIALAYKNAPKEQSSLSSDEVESGLVFLGITGMMDPPRLEAIRAIERCKHAGIRVMMATGDQKITAKAIAKQMGILRGDNGVVDGKELSKMTDDELTERIETIDVFARVEPAHKMRIVDALKRRGHVVAMTGDGVNDAPALKRADIGIAMGITGTDVSKEASEMVLTDDNFASIVGAVEEGRVIFSNIKKVVTYLISTNSGEMLTILVTVFSGLPLPLIPVQILWVNLVTDSFPGLALAADPPSEDVLSKPPRPTHERIISRGVIIRLLLVATIMAAGTVGIFYWGLLADGIVKARTLAFAVMAIFQLFNSLNVRSATSSIFSIGLLSNRWLVMAIVTGIVLQIAAIHLPFMQTLFRTTPLSTIEWFFVVLVASTVLWAEELRKLLAPRSAD